MRPKVAILIPTRDRADFILRQLAYYSSIKCVHPIYVGDSSQEDTAEKIKKIISQYSTQIKIHYYYLPGLNGKHAFSHLLNNVTEKYICYSGDDDFQVPRSFDKLVDFLEDNDEYESASGLAVSIRVSGNGPYGTIELIKDYPRPEITEDTSIERIASYLSNYYVPLFSINRTKAMIEAWKDIPGLNDESFDYEILPCSKCIISGKSKTLDCLGFIRQIHVTHFPLPNVFDWIKKNNWPENYNLFAQNLSVQISSKDNVTTDEAHKAVDRAMWSYLNKQLTREYAQKINNTDAISAPSPFRIKRILSNKFPALKNFYKRQLLPIIGKKLPLHYEVTNPKSKYYQDFKPIIDSVTNKP